MDFDFVNTDGKTALFVAVSRGNQVALDLLLTLPKGKVNLNIKSTTQSFEEVTPLMLYSMILYWTQRTREGQA